MKKIRIFEAFAGIGAQWKAFSKIKKNVKSVGMAEWFIPAIISYNLIHHFEKFQQFKMLHTHTHTHTHN